MTAGWPSAAQPLDLVGHQGDQRADHEGQSGRGEPGQLVAEALAAAGRHHDQAVAALERGLDRLALAGPETVIAHVGKEAVRVAGSVMEADRDRLDQLDAFEALEGESGLFLFVGEQGGLGGGCGARSDAGWPSARRGRAGRNQGRDPAGQGPRLILFGLIEAAPGAPERLKPIVDLVNPAAGFRFLLELGDQPGGFELEIG